TDRGLAAAIGSLPPHIAVRSRQEWGWFGPRTSKQRGFAYSPAIRRPRSTSAFTAVRQGRTHCIDGDSSHQAGQEDAAKADHDRECARERLPRHGIAIADGEAGNEREVDSVPHRAPRGKRHHTRLGAGGLMLSLKLLLQATARTSISASDGRGD